MNALGWLASRAGRWTGTSRLQDPHNQLQDESRSTLTITPVLGGRFVRCDYDWAYRGQTQEGSYLIGHEVASNTITAYWADTWHMGDKAMVCRGPIGPGESLSVRGSYEAPPGPDWGWRTEIAADGQVLRLVMHNVTPDGQEELAVDALYVREV
jgi:hypothetical protein